MNQDIIPIDTPRNQNRDDQWTVRYTSSVANGALYVRESRIVASLLLDNVTASDWKKAIYDDNILQSRSPRFARKVGNLARARLRQMSPGLLSIIRDESFQIATHACLAAAVKHSYLLGDFLDTAIREEYRRFSIEIRHTLWSDYLDVCRAKDTEMPEWAEPTHKALKSAVFQILAQAGFIESTTSLKLQTVDIAKSVINQLIEDSEDYVLRCITAGRW